MNRAGLSLALATAFVVGAFAQQSRKIIEDSVYRHTSTAPTLNRGGNPLGWNPGHLVLFKGTIRGIQESAPMHDGKSWVSLLVKLGNGGTALVELGPKEYVEAQSLRLRMKAPIWVSGSKSYSPNGDSVILAKRLNFDGHRPSFRRDDGRPFWEF